MIQVPGKIFISGEYAALKGLPALTVAVDPVFEFRTDLQAMAAFHPDSPAGLVNPFLRGHFEDPYKGIGGLGRSTAEFIAATVESVQVRKPWDLWRAYREVVARIQNTPSGVDLLTQATGGYCAIRTRTQSLEKLSWNFQSLDWMALVTGHKVKTHEHLSQKFELGWQWVEDLNQKITEAFKDANEAEFIHLMKEWRQFLFENQLETQRTTELIELFLEIPGVVAAKGCGAMGSDVIFVLYQKEQKSLLEKTIDFWNPAHVIHSSQVNTEGLKVLSEVENLSTL